MFDWLASMPGWLLAGLGLGAVLSGLIALAFVVGTRVFPDRERTRREDQGEAKRRREIRDYLRTIGEPFRESHEVADHTVAFYLPDRDVAVTFDAHAYFMLRRAGIEAILVEHEMPGAHLGHRLPFEVPEIGSADDVVARAFGILGLPPSASREEVRAAYRERVKEAHPDHGGDRESFERVRRAYAITKERE